MTDATTTTETADNWYQYYDKLLLSSTESSSSSSSSSISEDRKKWKELMGTDLMMKSITFNNKSLAFNIDNNDRLNTIDDKNNNIIDDNNTDSHPDTDEQSKLVANNNQQQEEIHQAVQVQDAVIVDIVGRYIPSTYAFDITTTTTTTTTLDIRSIIDDWPIFHMEQNLLLVIGDKDIVPCIEMGVRFMYLYETCLLYSHSKYAYGTGIRQSNFVGPSTTTTTTIQDKFILPSNSCVLYTITVKNIISTTICSTLQFKIQSCQSKKYIANDIVQNELLIGIKNNGNSDDNDKKNSSNNSILYAKGRALTLYKRSSEMLEYMLQQYEQQLEEHDQVQDNDNNEESRKQYYNEIKVLYEDCLNNICVIYMICKEYKLAKESAIIVLQYNSSNIKALIIAAKSSLYDPSSTFIEVQTAITAAQNEINNILKEKENSTEQQSHNNTNIMQLQNEINKVQKDFIRKKQQYKERNKQMSTNIAKKFSSTVAIVPTTPPIGTTTKTKETSTAHDDNNDKSNNNNNNQNKPTISNKNLQKQQQQQQQQSIQFVPNFIPTVIQWIQSMSYVSTIIKIVLFCFSIQIIITILFFIYVQYSKQNKSMLATTATTTYLSDTNEL